VPEPGISALAASEAYDGGPIGRFLAPFFARIAIPAEVSERLQRDHAEGCVVHVFRSSRVIDPLFLLHVLEKLGLPAPEFMHDHVAARAPDSVEALVGAMKRGEPALMFLRRPKTLAQASDDTRGPERYGAGFVEALIETQKKIDRPILLVPESLHWTRSAGGLRRTLIDVVFGNREAPGRMREILGFLLRHSASHFHVGTPVNLQAVLEREKDTPTPVIAKKIRWSILTHLNREESIRTGPVARPIERTFELVMNDPAVQRHLPPENLAEKRRALVIMKRLAADVRYGWIRVVDVIIDRIWQEIYDGIIVDAPGLQRVWSAARRGPVVLVPSHKSHIDYLVLSQVFFKDGMMPPHIAAGDNLSFWPLGHIFRRSGAFFIRRSFSGDKLYAALCTAYVRRVLKDGHALEFFIEGGRSRSGKLLTPKMGLLGMCVDPVLDGAIQDVSFIPVSISYEKIIEGKSYSRELEGGQKSKEGVGALLNTRKVLRSRFGRVYVDFDEPMSLRAFAAARGFEIKLRGEEAQPNAPRRDLTHQLGHRIVWGINRVTRVTPTGVAALVLLGQTEKGVLEADLMQRADRLISLYARLGARLSPVLANLDDARRAAVRETLGRFAQDGLVKIMPSSIGENVYELDERSRRALDFYKNNIVHFVVPLAILSLVLLAAGGSMTDPDARVASRSISRWLKHEFSFSMEADFDANFDAASRILVEERVITKDGDRLSVRSRPHTIDLASQIAPFFEAYRAAFEVFSRLEAGPRLEKEMIADALALAQRWTIEGKIRRAESASQPTLANAVRVALDLGALVRAEMGRMSWGPGGQEAVTRLAADLEALVSAVN